MNIAALPDDSHALKTLLLAERALLAERDACIRQLHLDKLLLEHRLWMALKRVYGPRADTMETGQFLLNFGLMIDARPVVPGDLPPGTSPVTATRRVEIPTADLAAKTPSQRGRRNLAENDGLMLVQKHHDLPDDQKPCPCCGDLRVCIGHESTWQLEHIPAKCTLR
jgi:hypothetical protein